MMADLGSNPSYVWRSLIWGRDIMKRGCVGESGMVNLYWPIQENGGWNEQEVRNDFPTDEAEAILNISLHLRGCEDIGYWNDNKDGKYSVKSGYALEIYCSAPPFQSNHLFKDWWKIIWNLNLPPKVRIFLWRASKNFIPASMNLFDHYVPVNGVCALCKINYATTCHVLFILSGYKRSVEAICIFGQI